MRPDRLPEGYAACDNNESPEVRESWVGGAVLTAARTVPYLVAIGAICGAAFSRAVRKEILDRDRYTCQSPYCVGYTHDRISGPRSMRFNALNGGWMVTAAHYPSEHGLRDDPRKRAGRCLCTACHVIEEIMRGNDSGARRLYDSTTMRLIA